MFWLFRNRNRTKDLQEVVEKQLEKNVRVIESLRDYDTGKKDISPVPSKNVCQAYELLHSRGLVSFPVTPFAEGKVASLIATITGTYYGHEIYPSFEEKAVAYLYIF